MEKRLSTSDSTPEKVWTFSIGSLCPRRWPTMKKTDLCDDDTIDVAAYHSSTVVLHRNACSSPNQALSAPMGAVRKVPRQNAKRAFWSARGKTGFAVAKFSFLSAAPICYATNMSGKHVLSSAQNTSIRGGTFMAADSVREAL